MPLVFCILLIAVASLIFIHLMWWSDSRHAADHNVTQHVLAIGIGVALLGGGVGYEEVFGTREADAAVDEPPPLKDMQVIEASLAMKKTKVTQPQKKFREPDPVKPPPGISHDVTKVPEKKDDPPPKPRKKDDPPPPTDPNYKPPHHPNDEDDPVGKPITTIGDFNGNEHGFALETKGDPYFQQLIADMGYTPPAIAKDEGSPVGCIHLSPDGKIPETKFMESTTGDFQTAAELALTQLKKMRNDNPIAVPDKLLPLTTKWLCFKFTVQAQ